VRTNIVLDDKLVKEAFKYVDIASKRELIDLALREFIKKHHRRDLRKIRGKIKFSKGYDYKSLRSEK